MNEEAEVNNLTIKGNVTLPDEVIIKDLAVSGSVVLPSDVTVTDLIVTDSVTLPDAVTINNLTINGGITIPGQSSLSDITITGALNVTGTTTVENLSSSSEITAPSIKIGNIISDFELDSTKLRVSDTYEFQTDSIFNFNSSSYSVNFNINSSNLTFTLADGGYISLINDPSSITLRSPNNNINVVAPIRGVSTTAPTSLTWEDSGKYFYFTCSENIEINIPHIIGFFCNMDINFIDTRSIMFTGSNINLIVLSGNSLVSTVQGNTVSMSSGNSFIELDIVVRNSNKIIKVKTYELQQG